MTTLGREEDHGKNLYVAEILITCNVGVSLIATSNGVFCFLIRPSYVKKPPFSAFRFRIFSSTDRRQNKFFRAFLYNKGIIVGSQPW